MKDQKFNPIEAYSCNGTLDIIKNMINQCKDMIVLIYDDKVVESGIVKIIIYNIMKIVY
jgi:hypothetical protein